MYTIEIELLDLSAASGRFSSGVPLNEIRTKPRACEAVAMEFQAALHDRHGELLACPTLFIWLPARARPELRSLASSELLAFNQASADLQHLTTCIGLEGNNLLVRCNARHLRHFPGEMETPMFCVVLVSCDRLAIALHRLDRHEMEAQLLGLQACCAASGPNYAPHRVWTEEEMAEAEGRVDSPEPRIITACVATDGD